MVCKIMTTSLPPSTTNFTSNDYLSWTLLSDEDGDTPLHIASAAGNLSLCMKIIQLWKANDISIDIRNKLMQTPLHLACITGNTPLVEMICASNPQSIRVADRHGNNAVHLAIKYATPDTVQSVVKATSNKQWLEAKNLYGYAPLHLASLHNKKEAIYILHAAAININLTDTKGGSSALVLAARSRHKEAAKALLELGANPNQRTNYGEYASQAATAHGDRGMNELLTQYDISYDSFKLSIGGRNSNDTMDSDYGSIETASSVEQICRPEN